MSLDDKLREIKVHTGLKIHAKGGTPEEVTVLLPKSVITQIKQALADEIIQPLGQGVYCSGAEWYARFEKEIHITGLSSPIATQLLREQILAAAKRAAGIAE